MIVRYLDPLERLEYEIIQRREDGSDARALDASFQQLRNKSPDEARKAARDILSRLADPVPSPTEPDDLAAIRHAGSPRQFAAHSLSNDDLYDRILGGWLGRAAGCLLGKPVERYMRPVLREILESGNHWPLDNYWTAAGIPDYILARYPWKLRGGLASLRENITGMPEDDDLNYPMLNLHVMEAHGYDFTSEDIGTAWLTKLPAYQVFTAERVAYFNFLNGQDIPDTARHMNPFREWIGAQIRADLWGYVSPGDPIQAAELAWRDARFSHTRNGIYGEMFFAALIAHAFTEDNPRNLVMAALTQIPQQSRLADAVRVILELPIAQMPWEDVLDVLEKNFGAYHWVHTINNAALVVAALLAGNGDFERTICYTVMGGWDTDSSGATAGSIIGIILGAASLPGKWIDPLNNRIRSSLGGFDNARFTDLAQRTLAVTQKKNNPDIAGHTGQSDDF